MIRRLSTTLAVLAPCVLLSANDSAEPEVRLPAFPVIAQAEEPIALSRDYVGQPQIELLNLEDLAEAARWSPGVTATPGTRGGPRNEQRLYLRGFDSRQILLLVDGIPFYLPYDGEASDFERFRTWNAEAIEISKGVTSVLYGPGAFGGAINVVTALPQQDMEVEAATEAGFDRTGDLQEWSSYATGGARSGNFFVQGGFAALERDFWTLPEDFEAGGPPVFDPRTPGNLEDGGRRERSAEEDLNAFARVGWEVPETGTYSLSAFWQDAEKQVPPYAGPPDPFERVNFFNWSKWDRRGLFFHGNHAIDEAHELRLRAYYSVFENRLDRFDNWNYDTQESPRAFRSDYEDTAIGGSAEWRWTGLINQEWIGVVHVRRDDHGETPSLLPGRETPSFTFIDDTLSLGLEQRTSWTSSFRTTAGLSYDWREPKEAEDAQRGGENFTMETSDGLNLVFAAEQDLSPELQARVGVARKVRLPAMIDRYSYRQGRSIPNPALDPEVAWNSEVGVDWKRRRVAFSATLFYSKVDDIMQQVVVGSDPDVPGTLISQVRNVGEADFYGFESSAAVSGDYWRAQLIYTYIERDLDGAEGSRLVGVPQHEAAAFVHILPGKTYQLIPQVRYASARDTSEFGEPGRVDDFLVWDLRGIWVVNDYLQVEVAVENLTDELYALDRGYPKPGRSFFVGLQVQL